MIIEDYVSFETAKLLKEKGFDESCRARYDYNGILHYEKYPIEASGAEMHNSILCPTLQMVTTWLREVHNIHIQVGITTFEDYKVSSPEYYVYISSTVDGKNLISYKSGDNSVVENGLPRGFKNYEEAIEEGIKYCLINLIK